MTAAGPTRAVRRAVWVRDDGSCQWCGYGCAEGVGDLQHRRARGSGGSSAIDTNLAGNLVLMHRECHTRVESHRDEALFRGFNVRQGVTSSRVPLQCHRGFWWLLNDEGGKACIAEGLAHEYLALFGMLPGAIS